MNTSTDLLLDQLFRIGFNNCAKCEKCDAPMVVYANGPWNYDYDTQRWVHTCIISDKPVD